MTKKSTIGMVLLVAMVLTKAFLFDYDQNANDFNARSESKASEVNAMADLRTSMQPTILPKTELIVAQLNAPKLNDFDVVSETSDNLEIEEYTLDDMAVEDMSAQGDEKIIPMDYVSNTGYGMWRTTHSEEEHAQQDDPSSAGIVPLDRGNTITDNISRMFPRIP